MLQHPPFRDDGGNLYVPEKVLADPGKAAALRIFIQYWGRGQAWINAHPEALARGYFAGKRGLPLADARVLAVDDDEVEADQAAELQQLGRPELLEDRADARPVGGELLPEAVRSGQRLSP